MRHSRFATVLVLFFMFALTACVSKEEYEGILSSWYGKNEVDIIESWGPPSRFYELGSKRYLTWSKNEIVTIPGTPIRYNTTFIGNTAYTTSSGGISPTVVSKNCDVTMTIEREKIVSWRYKGNSCYNKTLPPFINTNM